jgi:hypothetical protein
VKNLIALFFIVFAAGNASACISNISKRIDVKIRFPGNQSFVIENLAANETYTVTLNLSLDQVVETDGLELVDNKSVTLRIPHRKATYEVLFNDSNGDIKNQKIVIEEAAPQSRCM